MNNNYFEVYCLKMPPVFHSTKNLTAEYEILCTEPLDVKRAYELCTGFSFENNKEVCRLITLVTTENQAGLFYYCFNLTPDNGET